MLHNTAMLSTARRMSCGASPPEHGTASFRCRCRPCCCCWPTTARSADRRTCAASSCRPNGRADRHHWGRSHRPVASHCVAIWLWHSGTTPGNQTNKHYDFEVNTTWFPAKTYLQHPLRQAGLLGQLLQILGVRILIDRKVRFHRSQLVVLERGSHSFRSRVCGHAVADSAAAAVTADAAANAAGADARAGRLAAIVRQVQRGQRQVGVVLF